MKVNWMTVNSASRLTKEMTKERDMRCECGSLLELYGVSTIRSLFDSSFITKPMRIALECPQCRAVWEMPLDFRKELEKRLGAAEKEKACQKQ